MEHIVNELCIRRDGSFWFDDFKFRRPVFFNGNGKYHFSRGKNARYKLQKNNQEWLEILHQKVYRKKKDKLIPRLVVIEKGKKNKKVHQHSLVETPEHLSQRDFERFLIKSWEQTKGGGDCKIFVITEERGLKEYFAKDQDLETEFGIDEMNSYTNKSVSINS